MNNNNIIVYSTVVCPYCTMAKKLLQEKSLSYTEILVDQDTEAREKMVALSGRTSVPQIFMDDKHIGGYDDLRAYFKKS